MTDSTEEAWLDISPDKLPAVQIPGEELKRNPQFRELQIAMVGLTAKQKLYVRALPGCHYIPSQALKYLQAQGVKISERSVYRFHTDPAVKAAVACYRQLAGQYVGIDPLAIMLRIEAWASYCEEETMRYSRDGKELGTGRRDPVNGLKALELLGKHVGALAPDESLRPAQAGPALVMRLTQKDGSEIVIGATSGGRVVPNLSGPSDDSRLIDP